MTPNERRCVVTGLGVICAVGNNVEETWKSALNSVSGIHKTTSVDTNKCYADLAAEVKCDTLDEIDAPKEKDRVSKLCIKATKEALADAGLANFNDDQRVSVVIGSCVGGVLSIEQYHQHGRDVSEIAKMPIAAIASQVAETCEAGGIVTNVANACAAGTISIAVACDLIRAGKADVVIAGGADSFAAVPYSGFLSLHALDENGCSPFNRCNGITLGEGAGIVIVESYEHAQKRSAKQYCEILGSGVTSDANHITAPREDGVCLMEAISRAVKNSGIDKSDIGYVNAHGTGTGKNDNAEITAFKNFFGENNSNISVSSTKVLTGHCLGAAGAIEAVFSIKALTTDTVLPTFPYTEEQSAALKEKVGALDFVQNTARHKELKCVLSNNVAFGLKMRKVSKEETRRRVMDMLALVDLNGFEKRYPREMSGGQRQRVALARAMVIRPDLMLFDEPLSNLDAKLRVKMRVEIRRIQQELGFTAIYVTHDQEECFAISDQVAIMNQGVIEQMDSPAHIFNGPKTEFIAHFVGFENFFDLTRKNGALTTANGAVLTVASDRPGDRFKACIRPEDVQIHPADAAVPNALPGEVLVTTFLGRNIQYNVRTPIGEFAVKAEQGNVYSIGSGVKLSLSANKIILIDSKS